jgi:hypothetical protein
LNQQARSDAPRHQPPLVAGQPSPPENQAWADAPTVKHAAAFGTLDQYRELAPAAAPPKDAQRRWLRALFPARRAPRAVLLLTMLAAMLFVSIPLGLGAYSTYSRAKALAADGVRHLTAIKAKLPASSDQFTNALNQDTLDSLKPDIQAATSDFNQLVTLTDHSPWLAIGGVTPGLSGKIVAAQHLAHIGQAITQLANLIEANGQTMLGILHNSPLSATAPVITQANLDQLSAATAQAENIVNNIATQAQGASFGALLNASQIALLNKFLKDLPQVHQIFTGLRQLFAIAPTLFSLGKPTTYLIVTLDRSKLRAGGGFQGNYSVTAVEDGRLIDPLKLNDVYLQDLQNNGSCWNTSSVVPQMYHGWWPWNCWGLRDANLSADFPTSAQYSMTLFKQESGKDVDGIIAITPALIQQLLHITGPIYIGYGYNVNVSEDNLESVIHQFQLTHAGIAAGSDLPVADQTSSARKRFSGYLGQVLQDRLHGLAQNQMLQLFKYALADVKTKDIQIYVKNPQLEAYFVQQHIGGQMNRGPGDGVFIVDTNTSGKQTTFVKEQLHDAVQIDAHGNATHTLQLTYNFDNPTKQPTYGFAINGDTHTYRDYVRIYVPENATLMASSGNLSENPSDEPQRAMWSGYIFIHENTGPVTFTLQWLVPAVAARAPYTFTWQRQAGNQNIAIDLAVTLAGGARPTLHYSTSALTQDMTFTVPLA